MTLSRLLAFAVAAFLILPAAQAASPYAAQNAFVRETPTNITAAYLALNNPTGKADELQSAKADWAKRIELHTVTTNAKGVMQMKPVSAMPLPAKGQLTLKPGGYHLMVFDITQKLQAGETKTITLHFKNAGDMPVAFAVQPISFTGQAQMKDMKKMGHDMLMQMGAPAR